MRPLTAYNDFLQTEYARINHNIYKEALLEKADLLVKMEIRKKPTDSTARSFRISRLRSRRTIPRR